MDLTMNTMNKLLACLAAVYGFDDQEKSTLRKIGQAYDEKHNVHVIQLEYRVRRDDGGVVVKKKVRESLLHSILK